MTLALGNAPYQKTLAASLLAAGMLRRVLRERAPYLDLEVLDPGPDGSLKLIKAFPFFQFITRGAWAIWRRLPEIVRPDPAAIVLANCWLRDQLMLPWVEPSSIFHACTAVYVDSLGRAKGQGAITLVEHAARHERHWRDAVSEERRRFGVDRASIHGFSDRLIRRMDRIFAACDRIVVSSEVARQSFVEMGYANKVEVIPTGVDHELFSPQQQTEEPPMFRVCYVGRVELVKGIGYLLQAWKRLALRHAELVLVGGVNPDMKSLLATYADSTVRLLGLLPQEEVAKCYRESSIFVMPSVNEGLAQVLLEAMASGLTAVATDLSGASECITSGKDGIIVPARNVDALADAILWCYRHRDEIQAMGKAARARIESQFTLGHYNQRQIALYRELAGGRTVLTAP